MASTIPVKRKPSWLKRRLPSGPAYEETRRFLRKGCLHTVCQEAQCPNLFECFSQHMAIFLILGDRCTRNCRFCAVQHGPDEPPEPDEPLRVAQAAAEMGLEYVVITSTRTIRDSASGVIDSRVPIIAMTAYAMKGDRERCLESGMDDYVSKPINPKELLQKITRWSEAKPG